MSADNAPPTIDETRFESGDLNPTWRAGASARGRAVAGTAPLPAQATSAMFVLKSVASRA
jgi:hypothetical protein